MFRLGRHHARLNEWHKDLVGVDNVAVNARRRVVAGRVRGRLKAAAGNDVARVNEPVLHLARRAPKSRSAVSRSKVARRFEKC